MKRISFLTSFLFSYFCVAQHTFSIVAVDPITNEIGSAGATCLDFEDGALAISDIVLGVGAINTQAYWTTVNQNAAHDRMVAGDTPEEIISWLEANDNTAEGGNVTELSQLAICNGNAGNGSRKYKKSRSICFGIF